MNLNSLDLNLLIALDALLREANVSRAAMRIGLSQPAASHALQRLREAKPDARITLLTPEKLAAIDLFYNGERWAQERRPGVVQAVQQRLAQLAARLDGRDYLVESFSAADILMTTVLRILRHTKLVEEVPALAAYKQRCEARPAFAKALAGQMSAFEGH